MTTAIRGSTGTGAVVVWGLLVALTTAKAQTLPIPSGLTEAEIVQHAEADGATHRRAAASVEHRIERRCATGIGSGPAESGDFMIGGMLSGFNAMRAGREGKVWWHPSYRALEMTLVVRGRSLTNPTDAVRYTTDKVAWQVGGDHRPVPVEQRDYFFPSGITIPQPGRWLGIATSGANWDVSF